MKNKSNTNQQYNKYLFIIAVYFCIGFITNAHAQSTARYPIIASTQIIPPYSLSLADYVDPASDKIMVNIITNDQDILNYQVKLKLTIEGSGITIVTKPEFQPTPIFLNGGVPEFLSGSQLAQYFDADNLNFIGYSRSNYLQSGKLPEGIYRFTFSVVDYNRNTVVSNQTPALAWLVLNDPPIINMPQNNVKLNAYDPQNVVFQWTPRHTGSPNSAFTTEYVFKLFEIWDENRDPNNIVQSSIPIYETIVFDNRLIYGIAEPQLMLGKKYVFVVQARDAERRDLFKNNGYSEAFVFKYGDECKPPTNIIRESISGPGISVEWQTGIAHTDYEIEYRIYNSNEQWLSEPTILNKSKVYELQYGKIYEYRIKANCGVFSSEYSITDTVSLPALPPIAFECGGETGIPNVENEELLPMLNVGDIFFAGGFHVITTGVSGGGGTFSGEGLVTIPYLNNSGVKHTFQNIKLNTDKQLIEGELKSVYNPDGDFMVDLDDILPQREEEEETDPETEQVLNNEQLLDSDTSITVSGTIEEVMVNDAGQVVITTEEGETVIIEIEEGETAYVSDDQGGEYYVDASGNVSAGSQAAATASGGGTSVGGEVVNDNNSSTENENNANTFGPVNITFNSEIDTSNTDADGYCNISDADVNFTLKMMSDNFETKEIYVENASMSFSKNYNTGEFKDVEITYTNSAGLSVGDILFIEASITNIAIQIASDGVLTGKVDLNVTNSQDKIVYEIVNIKSGITGSFEFNYNELAADFSGNYNFVNVSNIDIDIKKSNKTIASLDNGSFGESGEFSGTLSAKSLISYQSNAAKIDLTSLVVDFSYSGTEGFKLLSGSGKVKVSNMSGVKGNISMDISVSEGNISSSISSKSLTAFGMELKDMDISVEMDNKFDVKLVEGSLKAKHPEFDADINISELKIEDGTLTKFSGGGSVSYGGYTLTVSNSVYENANLKFDAEASSENTEVVVNEVLIDSLGVITIGTISVDQIAYVGPIKVEFSGDYDTRGDISTTATAYLEMTSGDNTYEKKVSEVNIEINRRGSNFKSASLAWTGEVDLAEIYGINTKLKAFDIAIDDEENVTGSVTLEAYLDEDKSITDMFVLKEGIDGEFTFTFAGGNDLSGSFDYSGVQNINIDMLKSGEVIGQFRNGTLSSDGTLSGTLVQANDASYSSNSYTLEVNSLSVGFDYNFVEETVNINNGTGSFLVKDVAGMEGEIGLDVSFDELNVNATINSNNTDVKIYGLQLSNLSLTAEFDREFNLNTIEGSVDAQHDDFDAAIGINEFKIENGALTKFSGNGSVVYKAFNFELSSLIYGNQTINASAKVTIGASGTDAYLDVSSFSIDMDGNISIGKIEGEFTKSQFTMAFEATFSENRFDGSFDGSLMSWGVNGDVTFGSEPEYSYGYASLGITGSIVFMPGFKITSLGGQAGFNCGLNFNNVPPTVYPEQGRYVAGLTLGVGDMANTFELVGNPVVEFSDTELEFNMTGTLNIPRTNPVFSGTVNVNYLKPQQTISGYVQVDLSVPGSTGKIIKTSDTRINFYSANNTFSLSGSNMTLTVLNQINFVGNFTYDRANDENGNATSTSGSLNGSVDYHFSDDFAFRALGTDVTGSFTIDLSASLNSTFDDSGSEGEFSGNLFLECNALIENILWTGDFYLSTNANADVSYNNIETNISASMDVTLQSTSHNWDFDYHYELDKTITD